MNANSLLEFESFNKSNINPKVFPTLGTRFKHAYIKERHGRDLFQNEKVFKSLESENLSTSKYFPNEDGKQTARTATQSTKYTFSNRNRPKCTSAISFDNSFIWEINERVDTFTLRTSKKTENKTLEDFLGQVELGSQCYGEISQILKSAYPELVPVMSSYIGNVFKIFNEFVEFHKVAIGICQKNIGDLEDQMGNFGEKFEELNWKYQETIRLKRSDELKIENEVEKMFPSDIDELQTFKNKVQALKKIRPEGVCEILNEVYKKMSHERKIPEETDMNLEDFNTNRLVDSIKQSYGVIVTSTIKSVKKAFKSSFEKFNCSVQTTAIYIEPGKYEEICKQLDKITLTNQSNLMQLEKCKENLKTTNQLLEKSEIDRNQLKIDLQNSKQEVEYRTKEIYKLKLEVDNKKTETLNLQRQSTLKEKDCENLEKIKSRFENENSELKYYIARLEQKLSLPTGVMSRNRSRKEDITEAAEEKKKSLDAVGPSGLTVREELEKEYQLKKRGVKNKLDLLEPGRNNLAQNRIFNQGDRKNENKGLGLNEKSSSGLSEDPSEDNAVERKKVKKVRYVNDDSEDDEIEKNHQGSNTYYSEAYEKSKVQKHEKVKQKTEELRQALSSPTKSPQGKKNSEIKKDAKSSKSRGKSLTEPSKPKKIPISISKKSPQKTTLVMKTSSEISKVPSTAQSTLDKCCGNDICVSINIGVQVTNGLAEPEEIAKNENLKIHMFNPNNIYGLRGDIFFKSSTFQAQPRMPESKLPYHSLFLLEKPED